jgi:hypothetical protein
MQDLGEAMGMRFIEGKVKIWWRYLEDLPKDDLVRAVNTHIEKSSDRPSIARLRTLAGAYDSAGMRMRTKEQQQMVVWGFYRDKVLGGEDWTEHAHKPERIAIESFGGWPGLVESFGRDEGGSRKKFLEVATRHGQTPGD